MPIPDAFEDLKKQGDELLARPNAEKLKIFIPAEELKNLSPTQKLLLQFKKKREAKAGGGS